MPADSTHAQRLADTLVPGGWYALVNARRPGTSWRIIAREILILTEGVVDVTPETLRAWYTDAAEKVAS